jgi:hypothetical protein
VSVSYISASTNGQFVGRLTKRESFRLNWKAWSQGLPDRHNVILLGWPLPTPPTALSNISTANEMKRILAAVVEKTCHFDMANTSGTFQSDLDSDSEERDKINNSESKSFCSNISMYQSNLKVSFSASVSTSGYQRGGVLISMDNIEDQAPTVGKKRRRDTCSHSDITDKENAPLGGTGLPQKRMRRDASPTASATSQLPSHVSLPGDVTDTGTTISSALTIPYPDLPIPGDHISSSATDYLTLPPRWSRCSADILSGPGESLGGDQSGDSGLTLPPHNSSLLSGPAQYGLRGSEELQSDHPNHRDHDALPRLDALAMVASQQRSTGLTLPPISTLQSGGDVISGAGETCWKFPASSTSDFQEFQTSLGSTLTDLLNAPNDSSLI